MSTRLILVALLVAAGSTFSVAQDKTSKGKKGQKEEIVVVATERVEGQPTAEQIKALETFLTGAKFTGRFTIDGKDDASPKSDEYTLVSAKKLTEGDMWLIKSKMKYGEVEVTLPIQIAIKWAGDTPVMTMTKDEIPDLGTFSARVVIFENRYAGTWQHDDKGGHLYGTIKPADSKETKSK